MVECIFARCKRLTAVGGGYVDIEFQSTAYFAANWNLPTDADSGVATLDVAFYDCGSCTCVA